MRLLRPVPDVTCWPVNVSVRLTRPAKPVGLPMASYAYAFVPQTPVAWVSRYNGSYVYICVSSVLTPSGPTLTDRLSVIEPMLRPPVFGRVYQSYVRSWIVPTALPTVERRVRWFTSSYAYVVLTPFPYVTVPGFPLAV